MLIVTHIPELRSFLHRGRMEGKTIGFVPTMGALHPGHLSLIEQARQENDLVAASVFVNPEQFGPGEDFDRYPRQAEADAEMLRAAGTDVLFLPSPAEMYPVRPRFSLTPGNTANYLCGKSRPGHFAGVGIVVAKLLNLFSPDALYMGQKDLQQTVIIRQLIEDLNFPVRLVVCPIMREEDGLAMSSRNRYLSPEDRKEAAGIYQALLKMRSLSQPGMDAIGLRNRGIGWLEKIPGLKLDYLEIVRTDSLESVETLDPAQQPAIAVAAWFGKTRLIDNEMIFA